MKKIMVALLLVMTTALPVAIHAQDISTDVPPTQEVVETAVPTLAPTETPAPAPSPVDVSLLLPWILVIGIVAIGAVVSVAWVGILQAAKGLPEWSRPILLSNLKTGIDTLDNVTDGPIADAGIAELRRKFAELEAELNKTNAKVEANSQAVHAVARSQAAQG